VTALTVRLSVPVEVPVPVAGGGAANGSRESPITMALRDRPVDQYRSRDFPSQMAMVNAEKAMFRFACCRADQNDAIRE
jgi:hypothetical protein